MNKATTQYKINAYLIWMSIAFAFAFFLIIRSTGLYPTVFSDEYTYSMLSRLTPMEEANIPGYLYFFTYKATNLCGDGFLECARVFNVAFFVLAIPFIYLIGKKLTGEKTALLIATLSMLGPLNSYTAYFMPESFYFLSFWMVSYSILIIKKEHAASLWILAGFIFGVSALIKPHSLFLVPALGVYFFIFRRRSIAENSSMLAGNYFLFFIAAISTKLIIGFSLAGYSGLTLFGTTYTSIASGAKDSSHYISLMKLALESLQGHLLALSLLFSVPIGQLLLTSKFFFRRNSESHISINIALYTSLIFTSLLIVVAFFTASVSGSSPSETGFRLHMRYYNFAFPLLLLVAASQLTSNTTNTKIRSRALVGLPIGAAICYAVYTYLSPYTPSFVDSPEIRGFTFNSLVFYVLSAASIFSLATWVYADRPGIKVFLYLFMPLTVGFSTFYVNQELRHQLVPNVFDKAGIFAKKYLSSDEITKTMIVGSDLGDLFRSQFYLDTPTKSLNVIPKGADFDLSNLPPEKEWVLIIGNHSLVGNAFHQIPMTGFTLVRPSGLSTIDFKKPVWGARGLSSPELWGTWSQSDVVVFEFTYPLPGKFNLQLTAHAFGPNVGREIEVHVGTSVTKFKLDSTDEERVLTLNNPERSKEIRINIPNPTSPKALGINADERNLGIGFVEMKIVPEQTP